MNGKIVCTEESIKGVSYVWPAASKITLDKPYDLIRYWKRISSHPIVLIVNDAGVTRWYDARMFITIDEWRERQIEKII